MAGDGSAQPDIREVSSSTNSLLKVFRRTLIEGVTRDGWLAVEGPRLVEEAVRAAGDPQRTGPDAGVRIHSVLVSQSGLSRLKPLLVRLPREAELARVSDRLFRHVAATETPQGIAALIELRAYDLDAILAVPNALLLVACGLQDPGNLGTILRSAHAFGATGLLTLKATVCPFNPKAVRASAGAIFRSPVFRGLESAELFRRLRTAGIRTVAADRHSAVGLAKADLRGPVAFLIGQEAEGLESAISRQASLRLSIPIRPETDSLNAAVAAGIFLYEAARQRGFCYRT